MRFLHTADWQIGKPFRNFGDKESVLRQARLAAGTPDEEVDAIAAKIEAFIRTEVIPYEKDPRTGPHGPSDELVQELRDKARKAFGFDPAFRMASN